MTDFNESTWFLQLRRKKHFSQSAFGELLGLSQPTIADIESGTRKVRLHEFLALVGKLDLKYDEYPNVLKRHQIIDKILDIIAEGNPNHELVKLRTSRLQLKKKTSLERERERVISCEFKFNTKHKTLKNHILANIPLLIFLTNPGPSYTKPV